MSMYPSLQKLGSRSRHAVIGTALDARCLYLTIGGRRLLVTETRLRVDGMLSRFLFPLYSFFSEFHNV
jgi:hypothetical protein